MNPTCQRTTTLLIVAVLMSMGPVFGVAAADRTNEIPGAPHLLPENTMLYARLDDANQAREDFARSSIGRMMSDPKLKPLATDMFAVAADLFESLSQQAGVSLDDLMAIPTGQVAFAVIPGNPSERHEQLMRDSANDESEAAIRERLELKRKQLNSFASVLLVEAGENIDDLMALIERLEATVTELGYVRRDSSVGETEFVHLLPPRPDQSELEYFVKEGTLVFGIGHRISRDVLDRWTGENDEPTLADRADFGSVMSRCIGAEETRPQITFYIDAYRLIEKMVKRQSMAALFWPLFEDLGFSKIRGIGGSLFRGGNEFESIVHVHVLIDPPRDGLFGVLRPETVDIIPPDWIPADATSYTSIGWDFAQAYENFGKILDKFQQGNLLKENIEQPVQEILGVSFTEDVLPGFTGRYVNCQWIERPVKLNSQATAQAIELTNPETAKSALEKFRTARGGDVSIETIHGAVVYFFDQSALPGAERRASFREAAQRRRQARQQTVPNAAPDSDAVAPEDSGARAEANELLRSGLRKPEACVVILGNWAIYCDSRKMVERLILANRQAVDRLIEVPEYDLIVSEMGGKLDGEKPFLISYLRGADYVRQMYELAQSPETRKFLRTRGKDDPVSGRIVDLIDRNELPPFDEFELYFAPSGFFGYDEPNGIHFGMFTLRSE